MARIATKNKHSLPPYVEPCIDFHSTQHEAFVVMSKFWNVDIIFFSYPRLYFMAQYLQNHIPFSFILHFALISKCLHSKMLNYDGEHGKYTC